MRWCPWIAILLVHAVHAAPPALDPLFQDEMVLQRDAPFAIWGTADPGTHVTVQVGASTAKASSSESGTWKVQIPPQAASTGTNIELRTEGFQQERHVLFGDVWVCAGQSNMDFPLRSATGGEKAAKKVDLPLVRLMILPDAAADTPQRSHAGQWKRATPESSLHFSAIGFFFGQIIAESEEIPIGLIRCSKGATPIARWLPEKGDLFNGMVWPISMLPIKGVIWYQGESDVEDPEDYAHQLHALIVGWRKAWNAGNLPMIVVQLPRYGSAQSNMADPSTGWAAVRQAQAEVARSVPQVFLATAGDLVMPFEIHPPDKQPVAERVASLALRNLYGRNTRQ